MPAFDKMTPGFEAKHTYTLKKNSVIKIWHVVVILIYPPCTIKHRKIKKKYRGPCFIKLQLKFLQL